MKPSAITNIALLGYLVFFLNLGPSFHRAPIFGLHDHVTSHSPSTDGCCCGHDHAPASNQQDAHPDDLAIEQQLCDCSVCHFFKQYNVSVTLDDISQRLPESSGDPELSSSQANRISIRKSARGPPTA